MSETRIVTLILTPRFPLLSLAICTESLRLANRELGWSAYDWRFVTESGGPVVSSSGIELPAMAALNDITQAPISIVLTSYDPEESCTPELMAWLRKQDRLGGILGCIDTGGYVLARAGLLRGRHIAVHHETLPAYAEFFGEAIAKERLHVLDGRIASSAGGMATLDMMLLLIERDHGVELPRRIAHILNYERLAETASDAGRREGALARTDRRLGRLVELMQASLEDPLPLSVLCGAASVDKSTCLRLFRKHLRETPGQYYLMLRLNRARSLLTDSALPISEIASLTGFADATSFGRAFKRTFGLAPSKARVNASGVPRSDRPASLRPG